MSTLGESVTLTPEQIEAFAKELSLTRHAINNQLALMLASVELMQLRPEKLPDLAEKLMNHPGRISDEIQRFSQGFNETLGASKPNSLV